MAHWVGALGQVKLDKNAKTSRHFDVPHKELQSRNEKNFLISTGRLAESVEGLNISLAHSAGE